MNEWIPPYWQQTSYTPDLANPAETYRTPRRPTMDNLVADGRSITPEEHRRLVSNLDVHSTLTSSPAPAPAVRQSDWQPPPPQPPRTHDASVFDTTADTVVVETQGVNGSAGVPTRIRTPRQASGKIKIAVPLPGGGFEYRWVNRDDPLVHPVARHG
jgi:hypothetical protein